MDIEIQKIIVGGIVTFISIFLTWKLNKIAEKHKNDKEAEVPVIQADFFADVPIILRDCENMKIEHLNEGRQRLAKDYTKHKIESFVEPSKKFALSVDRCCADCKKDCNGCNELMTMAKTMLIEGLKYEETFKELAENINDLEALIIFNDRFKIWHEPHVDRYMNKIENICKSSIFKSCNNKGHLILIELENALYTTISEMISTAMQINGQLTDKVYKNNKL